MTALLCPACMDELVTNHELRTYELTDEHICDPNGERAPRTALVCPNSPCPAFQRGVFWAPDGDGPYNTKMEESIFGWIDHNPHPFNSDFRAMYFSIYYKEEDKKYKTKWFMLHREVRYASDSYGNKVGKRVHYSMWKMDKKLRSFVHYIPGVSMLYFVLHRFYKLPEGMRPREAQEIVKQMKWPRAEWWRKVAALWIKTFHSSMLVDEKPDY